MTARYVVSALLRRPLETVAATLAVALTVAYLVALGSFVSQSGSRLAETAGRHVPVDWQVQVTPGQDPAAARAALRPVQGLLGFRAVDYARVRGLESTSVAGVRTTGAAYVVALPVDYRAFAPGEIRPLVGAGRGTLLLQQTAANLAASPGSTVHVLGVGVGTRIDGVVDLPAADSFFQVVGAVAGPSPAAPPDNVLIVAPDRFAALTAGVPVVHQFHVRIDHRSLPSEPAQAADVLTRRAGHYLSTVPGGALVGDNLGAALGAAREDALYAQLLVLLLGAPGLVLAGVVTALVISLRNDRQYRDLTLLRLRGVTPRRAGTLLGLVAIADGLLGSAVGVAGALAASFLALPGGVRLSTPWALAGVGVGVLLAVLVELAPGLRPGDRVDPQQTVAAVGRTPLPLRLGLDVLLLVGSGTAFWLTSRGGYKVVVVPEGVPATAVNYGALLAPALAWPGVALLIWRLVALVLRRRPRPPLKDPGGKLSDLRRDAVRRRRHLVARGATGLAVAVAVTVSTAVFTATYDRQARTDTALTVGSDVAVTLPPDASTSLDPAIARKPGVLAVERVAHRLAYVGPDLQDLYGIDAATVGRAAPLQDAFTPGTSVAASLRRLAATPDGVLLSQETLHDYQLHTGDQIRLRLRDTTDRYRTIGFHVVGVITEFATAPRDSFILANRAYLGTATGRSQVETLLVRTDSPARVAAAIHAPVGALLNDITAPRTAITSATGLAAGVLGGLARLTLAFGLVLAAAYVGLVLLVGAAQRQRALAALAIVGATRRQTAAFIWTEGRWIVLAGLLAGVAAGGLIAAELVKILNGIFDPPPETPAIPWAFVGAVGATVAGIGVLATLISARYASRVDVSRLREL